MFEVCGFEFLVSEFRVRDSGAVSRVWGVGFEVSRCGVWVPGFGFHVWGLGFGVWGLEFGGFGVRVERTSQLPPVAHRPSYRHGVGLRIQNVGFMIQVPGFSV